jgi:hypothetical protein
MTAILWPVPSMFDFGITAAETVRGMIQSEAACNGLVIGWFVTVWGHGRERRIYFPLGPTEHDDGRRHWSENDGPVPFPTVYEP